ncbi:MAG: hypothetical protein RSE36_07330, partial [Oscillospiraceae bacterium]
ASNIEDLFKIGFKNLICSRRHVAIMLGIEPPKDIIYFIIQQLTSKRLTEDKLFMAESTVIINISNVFRKKLKKFTNNAKLAVNT